MRLTVRRILSNPLFGARPCGIINVPAIRGATMSIRTLASGASAWRGYEYFEGKKVLSFSQTGEDEHTGQVAGSGSAPYQVKINTAHPRQSKCNCPHADGRRVICKHMVALFFSAFPEEAEQYMEEVEEYEREEEQRMENHYEALRSYVKSLSKKELQDQLFEALAELSDRGRRYYR